jgi:hypothetical protein
MTQEEKITLIIFTAIYSPLIIIQFLVHLGKIKIPKLNFKKILISNLIILVLAIIGIGVLSHTNYLDYEKPIPYSQYDRISFKNFRGLELFKKKFLNSKYFAYVVTSIDLEEDTNSVVAYFHPSRSFVYNKKSGSKDLLTHELYHFKITEIFARKTRKEIIENKISSFEKRKEILNINLIEEQRFQELYDYETYHSYIYSKQREYEKKIDSLLLTLNVYKNQKLNINEKN